MSSMAEETRWLDATAQAALVQASEATPTELVEAAIERIEAGNPALNAVVTETFDRARDAAASAQLPRGPFHGVPFLVKDLWALTEGDRCTNGVLALARAGWRAPIDTTLVGRHRTAGLVILGRTNTPELGILPTTEPMAFGPTHNPWDLERSPGGSSGGSAAAVAAGLVPAAHASDGGGSIRIPASCCGLVGLKVSQGRTTLGPLRDESGLGVEHVVTRSVRDAAALLDATCGPGVGDTVIAPAPLRPYLAEVGADPGRLRIGVLLASARVSTHAACVEAAEQAAALLASLGHHVEETHPDGLEDEDLVTQFTALWAANTRRGVRVAGQWLERQLGPEDVEPLTWALAERAAAITADDYLEGLAAVSRYRRRVQQWWHPTSSEAAWDLLLTPTLAGPPPRLGEMAQNPDHPFTPFARAGELAAFTPAFNTTGQPAISLPLHVDDDGLPVGVQQGAAYGREDVLVRVAAQLEEAAPWADRHPQPTSA